MQLASSQADTHQAFSSRDGRRALQASTGLFTGSGRSDRPLRAAGSSSGDAPSSPEKRPPMAPGDQAPEGTPGSGETVCPGCGGSGKGSAGAPCPTCQGRGKVTIGIGGG